MLNDLLQFLEHLGKKLQSILYWFTDKIGDALVGLWNWIVDALCYCVEIMFKAIDFPVLDTSFSFVGMPPQMIWILNQIGIDIAITILTAAIICRVMLNLIPGVFTRV